MSRKIDLVNRVFGDLTVIEETDRRDRDKRVCWLCRCTCGIEKIVSSRALLTGQTKSCGSGHYASKTRTKRTGEITGDHWNHIKKSATKRKIKFNLSIEEAWKIFEKQNRRCALTGRPISFPPLIKSRKMPNRGRTCTASLDRINSSKGYIKGNVQWVHKDLNLAKHILNNEEFINLCREVIDWNNKSK